MTSRIAILGGSGQIGRRLAAALEARGDDVVVLSRDPARARRSGAVGRVESWSADDIPGLARQLDGLDGVVNLAGVPVGPWPWTPWRRRLIRSSRLEPTTAIVTAMEALPADRRPRVLVNASGTDRYEGRDQVPATEATPSADGFLADLCRDWEAAAERATSLGVRVAVLRIGFVLARNGKALRLFVLPFRMRLGGPLGSGRQWMSWIHVDDVVGLLIRALDDPAAVGPINAVSPTPAHEAELADAIGAAMGRRSWLRVPAFLIRLVMRDASILALGSRRIVPPRALELGHGFAWTDLRAAVRDVLAK